MPARIRSCLIALTFVLSSTGPLVDRHPATANIDTPAPQCYNP